MNLTPNLSTIGLPLSNPSSLSPRLKARLHKNRLALVLLGISLAILALYSVYFFFPYLDAYLKAPATLDHLESQVAEYEEIKLPTVEKERDLHRAAYDEEYEKVIGSLDKVFPKTADRHLIVSTLEGFASKVGQAYPPFAFNSITFEPSIVHPEGYIVTPVSTSIQASATAFQKFLDLVNFSGYLDQSEMIPVMSIANIQIRYSESDSGEAGEVVNVSTKINFYSRPQEKNS